MHKPPARLVLQQRRIASPYLAASVRGVRCASYSHNLEPWQLERLEQAYNEGKRNVKVSLGGG